MLTSTQRAALRERVGPEVLKAASEYATACADVDGWRHNYGSALHWTLLHRKDATYDALLVALDRRIGGEHA